MSRSNLRTFNFRLLHLFFARDKSSEDRPATDSSSCHANSVGTKSAKSFKSRHGRFCKTLPSSDICLNPDGKATSIRYTRRSVDGILEDESSGQNLNLLLGFCGRGFFFSNSHAGRNMLQILNLFADLRHNSRILFQVDASPVASLTELY